MTKIESILIKKLILEDDQGARVVIVIPRGGTPFQEGGILRNISLGAISTTELINDFKKSRLRKADQNPGEVPELTHGVKKQLEPFNAEAQMNAALKGAEAPPVFVEDGKAESYCTCSKPLGTRRCLTCGLLIPLKDMNATS